MADDFTAGDQVRVKAAFFRRPGGVIIQRGQVFTLDEDDLKRSDVHMLVEHFDETMTGDLVQALEGEPDDAPESEEGDLSTEELRDRMAKMNLKHVRQFLAHESWTLDEMRLAREAEQAGKNRPQVLETIDNRILDLEDEDDSGAPA